MTDGIKELAHIISQHSKVCYYPSAGTDLSDLDFFGSGKRLWSERAETPLSAPALPPAPDSEIPDLFIHTDVNFYMEYEEGLDLEADECGLHGGFEILSFKELTAVKEPNKISPNFDFSGRIFQYQLKVWGFERILTLIFIIAENEWFVSKVLLNNHLKTDYMWSKDWAGSLTCGTWFANVCKELKTEKIYCDWLCIPGFRGQPLNRPVTEHYPELMSPKPAVLTENQQLRWIDRSQHGWISEYSVS